MAGRGGISTYTGPTSFGAPRSSSSGSSSWGPGGGSNQSQQPLPPPPPAAPAITQNFTYNMPQLSPAGGGEQTPIQNNIDLSSLGGLFRAQQQNIESAAPGWETLRDIGAVAPGLGQRNPPQSMQALRARIY